MIGTADDLPHVPANGDDVLTYAQAIQRASAWDPHADPDKRGELVTVADVCEAYLEWADEHRRSAQEARYAINAHLLPELGEVAVADLTVDRLRRWHAALARKPARTRSPESKQRYRAALTEDAKRARRATANRILAVLKAALNRAWGDGVLKGSDDAWRRVRPFRGVERSRARYLELDEIRRLLNAIDEADCRDLVAGAVYTGARYQELARLHVQDVQLDAGALMIRQSKTDTPRSIFLNEEGRALFDAFTVGRSPADLVFSRGGSPWGKSDQQPRMRAACERARIEPRITFHGLRHTYASHYLMNGGGLADLAKQLGHATTVMVERHYGHLADDWRADRAKRFAPSIGQFPAAATPARERPCAFPEIPWP